MNFLDSFCADLSSLDEDFFTQPNLKKSLDLGNMNNNFENQLDIYDSLLGTATNDDGVVPQWSDLMLLHEADDVLLKGGARRSFEVAATTQFLPTEEDTHNHNHNMNVNNMRMNMTSTATPASMSNMNMANNSSFYYSTAPPATSHSHPLVLRLPTPPTHFQSQKLSQQASRHGSSSVHQQELKKKKRRLDRPVRYHSRKAYADIRPRIKGRFAKREDLDETAGAGVGVGAGANTASTSTSSIMEVEVEQQQEQQEPTPASAAPIYYQQQVQQAEMDDHCVPT